MLTVINSCGDFNVSKSWTSYLFIFFNLHHKGQNSHLTSGSQSGQPSTSLIRKEKPRSAGTQGAVCYTATAGLHTSLSHTVALSLLFPTTLPSMLLAIEPVLDGEKDACGLPCDDII